MQAVGTAVAVAQHARLIYLFGLAPLKSVASYDVFSSLSCYVGRGPCIFVCSWDVSRPQSPISAAGQGDSAFIDGAFWCLASSPGSMPRSI